MKKRRSLLLILSALLLIVGIPMGWLVWEYRHEQAGRDLIAAIKADNTPVALAALKAGADPNTRDYSNDEPLSFNARLKQIFDKILRPNRDVETDGHLTALRVHLNVRRWDNPTLVKALLDAGADLHNENDYATSILCTVAIGHSQTLRLLLHHDGHPALKDDFKRTVFEVAAINGDVESTRALLDVGADINAQNDKGETPLDCAIQHDNHDLVPTLLLFHANPNLRNKGGLTALDWALDQRDAQVIALLRKAGAKTGHELSSQSSTPH